MKDPRRSLLLLLTFFSLIGKSAFLWAEDENYQAYPLGEEASSMGGAYTALSESADGTFYNPSGIARVSHSSVNLSASAFRLTKGTVANGIALTPTRRAGYPVSAVQVIPTSTVILKKFKSGKAVAFSVHLPDSILFTGKTDIENVFFSQQLSNQTLWIGPTYAQPVTDRLSVGGSLYFLDRTFYRELYTRVDGTPATHQFSSTNASYLGLLPILGAKYDLTDHWKVGATVRPYYSIRLGGTAEINTSTTAAKTTLSGLEVDSPTPIRADFGIAYRVPGVWTVSGDASVNLPHTFVQIHDPQGRVGDGSVTQELTINAALGMEYYITKTLPFRCGLFTDLSSAPELPEASATVRSRTDNIGFTTAVGYLTENTTMSIGLLYSLGLGKTTDPADVPASFLMHNINISFAGSYRFQ